MSDGSYNPLANHIQSIEQLRWLSSKSLNKISKRQYFCPFMPGLARNYQIHNVVEGEYGLLVPVRDIDALVEGIIRLIDNKDMRERYSQAGMIRAHDFDIPRIAEEYLNTVFGQLQQKNVLG